MLQCLFRACSRAPQGSGLLTRGSIGGADTKFEHLVDLSLRRVGQFPAIGLAAIDLGRTVSGVLELAHDLRVAGASQREFDAAAVP